MIDALRAALAGETRWWLFAKIGLTLVFVGAGIAYFAGNWQAFSELHWPSPWPIAAVSAAFVANLWLVAWFNFIVARKLGADISRRESFGLSTIAAAANFLLPLRAGTAVRAYYMKRAHGLAYSHFASTLAVYYLFNLVVAALATMLCVAILYADSGILRPDLFLVLPAILLAAGVTWRRKSALPTQVAGGNPLANFAGALRQLLADRRIAAGAALVVCAGFLASTAGWTIALRDYAPMVSVPESFLIVVSQIVGGLVTITAGSTGFQELAGLYVGQRLGMTLVELFAVLVWTKVLRILVSLTLAIPSTLLLRRKLRGDLPANRS